MSNKTEFLSTLTKINILQNAKKLKGTSLSISADHAKIQQERNKVLGSFPTKLRSSSDKNCYIKQEKLYCNNTVYTVEDILEINLNNKSSPVMNSAPQTPSNSSEQKKEKEEEKNLKGREEKEDKDNTKASETKPTVNSSRNIQLRNSNKKNI